MTFFEKLKRNKDTSSLVRRVSALDLMKELVKTGLMPKEAAKLVYDLHKSEGLSGASIETNMQYPIPPSRNKTGDSMISNPYDPDEEEQDKIPESASIGHDVKRWQFPPDPRGRPGDWPYDDASVAAVNPKNKGKRRPLMQGAKPEKRKKYIFKEPLATNHSAGQPGGAGDGVQSTQRVHSRDGNTSGSGRSWSKHGYPGWSKPPKGKGSDVSAKRVVHTQKAELPEEDEKEELPGNESEITKELPFGAGLPQFSQGPSPRRLSKAGYRGYGKR